MIRAEGLEAVAGVASVRGARVGLICAPYYREVAALLLQGARAVLEEAGAQVEAFEVAGALELPGAIALLEGPHRRAGREGYVALGCVIRGETSHYDIVCGESARGLMELALQGRFAVANGVLTVENTAQALERADPARLDKGGEAARACLALIALQRAQARA
jgi:6,7-dimethyl-8-ribityllumazine synthase